MGVHRNWPVHQWMPQILSLNHLNKSLPGELAGAAPITVTIPEAVRLSGLSRSEIYRRLADQSIQAVKSGTRTLIVMDSLRAHLAGLRPATFRLPKAAA
jgi:hypothetical protein